VQIPATTPGTMLQPVTMLLDLGSNSAP
jgi:hypothetical protein